jgi:hypothetical protein
MLTYLAPGLLMNIFCNALAYLQTLPAALDVFTLPCNACCAVQVGTLTYMAPEVLIDT